MRDKVLKALEKVKTMLSADGGSAEYQYPGHNPAGKYRGFF